MICDQTIRLTGTASARDYPAHLRPVAFRDPETGKKLDFLTNDVTLPALPAANLYRLFLCQAGSLYLFLHAMYRGARWPAKSRM